METKQVIVIRKDLRMRQGKAIAQGCHASLAVITKCLDRRKYSPWLFSPTIEMEDWLDNSFTKICVYVNSEDELLDVYNKAHDAELPCSLIKDSGKTEFKEPTFTAVAVGPAEISKVDSITGKLPLF